MQVTAKEFLEPLNTFNIELPDEIYALELNQGLVHQVVTSILSSRRQATKGHKSRSDVSGGGAKPWRQKGTGRARAGTSRSPIWRSGGKTFAHNNYNFKKKINKKEYRLAMKQVMAELTRSNRIQYVSDIVLDSPKTQSFSKMLSSQGIVKDCLIVVDNLTDNLILASRNLIKVDVITSAELNPCLVLAYETVIITQSAANEINEALLS